MGIRTHRLSGTAKSASALSSWNETKDELKLGRRAFQLIGYELRSSLSRARDEYASTGKINDATIIELQQKWGNTGFAGDIHFLKKLLN